MALYALQLIDMEGTAIEPGFGGAIYRSNAPLPIPSRGDTIKSYTGEFMVEKLTYEYTSEKGEKGTYEPVYAVTVHCSLISSSM